MFFYLSCINTCKHMWSYIVCTPSYLFCFWSGLMIVAWAAETCRHTLINFIVTYYWKLLCLDVNIYIYIYIYIYTHMYTLVWSVLFARPTHLRVLTILEFFHLLFLLKITSASVWGNPMENVIMLMCVCAFECVCVCV